MKLNEAIEAVADYYIDKQELPSHCDVRCSINDLLDDTYNHKGYDQNLAYKKVKTIVERRLFSNRVFV